MTQSNQSTSASEDSVVEIEDPEPYFAKVPEWVIVSGVSPQAMALYAILIAHMNRKEGNRAAFPGMDVLATLLGFRRRQSVKPYIAELEAIKAISVVKERTGTGWRNRYILRRGVPADHAGPSDLTEFHAIRRRTPDGGMCGTAHQGMDATAHDPMCGPAHTNQTNSTRRSEPDEDASSGDACAAGGQRTSSLTESSRAHARGKIHIVQPRNFNRLDDGQIAQALTAACLAAITKSGLVAADNAPAALGNSFKRWLGEGLTRQQLLARVRDKMPLVGTADEGWGWLASEPVDASFDPWAA